TTGSLEEAPSFFFFQAEDGIRDRTVTGVQTCALPILLFHELGEHLVLLLQLGFQKGDPLLAGLDLFVGSGRRPEGRDAVLKELQIGRASCRERVKMSVGGGALKNKGERLAYMLCACDG